MKVIGLTLETALIHPSRSSSGTKTGERNVATKMGVWIRNPPELVRNIIAMPTAKSVAATLTSTARPSSPKRSTPLPSTCMPLMSAATVATPPVTVTLTSETIMYPKIIPSRLGAASMKRWANPPSKSRAIAKPVKAPPIATVCKRIQTYWKAV